MKTRLHFSVLQRVTHWHEFLCVFLYLCWAHSCQLSHVDVQDVQLQPAGRSAAALQELSRQQLQEARHHAEETAHTPLLSLKCDTSMTLKGLVHTVFNTLPAVPVFPLEHLKRLSEHEANQLLETRRKIISYFIKLKHLKYSQTTTTDVLIEQCVKE